jgi:hypothetical protein
MSLFCAKVTARLLSSEHGRVSVLASLKGLTMPSVTHLDNVLRDRASALNGKTIEIAGSTDTGDLTGRDDKADQLGSR